MFLEQEVSKYRGVYKAGSKFCAKVYHEGTLLRFGNFDRAKDAAVAYDDGIVKAKRHVNPGELNFPERHPDLGKKKKKKGSGGGGGGGGGGSKNRKRGGGENGSATSSPRKRRRR